MANPVGNIKSTIKIITKETVRQDASFKGSVWADITTNSTECPSKLWTFTSEEITYQDTGGSDDGYLNGSPVYVSATTSSVAAITGLTNVEFVCFKHTGRQYSSSSALSSTANTIDCICIRGGAVDGFVIAVLKAGAGIVLPVRSNYNGAASGWSSANQVDSGDYFIQSVDPANLSAGGNTIAMEFICVSHS